MTQGIRCDKPLKANFERNTRQNNACEMNAAIDDKTCAGQTVFMASRRQKRGVVRKGARTNVKVCSRVLFRVICDQSASCRDIESAGSNTHTIRLDGTTNVKMRYAHYECIGGNA